MTHIHVAHDSQLRCDTRGMGVNVHDGAVLWFFTAWFLVAVLAFSGAAAYAIGLAIPVSVASVLVLTRWVRGRGNSTDR